jgi:hypothetical protein
MSEPLPKHPASRTVATAMAVDAPKRRVRAWHQRCCMATMLRWKCGQNYGGISGARPFDRLKKRS